MEELNPLPSARLFWAVPFETTPALAEVLTDLQRWQSHLKITQPEHLHLTLKFLGDTPPERIPVICEAGRQLVCPTVSQLAAQGLGVFPPRGRPTVLWAGLSNAEALVQLANLLDDAMQQLGYAPERRTFHPHLTLARIKNGVPRPMLRWLEKHVATDFGMIPVRNLVLFRSQLTPQGSIYTPVLQVPLVGVES